MAHCIIHIGMHKTGTTSIQESLNGFSNDEFLYADLGHSNHSLAIYSLFSDKPELHHLHRAWRRDAATVAAYINDTKKKLKKAIELANNRTLIISGEDIGVLPHESIVRMRDYFIRFFDKITIIGYVRSPASFIASGFQERLKAGLVDQLNLEKQYRCYKNNFGKFDEIFGRENVILKKFDPKLFSNGCVVLDFCSQIHLPFSPDKVVKLNESISRQAVSLLYTYQKMSGKLGFKKLFGPECQRVCALLSSIGNDKFRFSPDIIRPVLEKNRHDIEWIETRLGVSLSEDLETYRLGDVGDESDLLTVDPLVVEKLRKLFKKAPPQNLRGNSPEEVAKLVNALRNDISGKQIKPTSIHDLIEEIQISNPNLFKGIPKNKAVALIRIMFRTMNEKMQNAPNGKIEFSGFGQFLAIKSNDQQIPPFTKNFRFSQTNNSTRIVPKP